MGEGEQDLKLSNAWPAGSQADGTTLYRRHEAALRRFFASKAMTKCARSGSPSPAGRVRRCSYNLHVLAIALLPGCGLSTYGISDGALIAASTGATADSSITDGILTGPTDSMPADASTTEPAAASTTASADASTTALTTTTTATSDMTAMDGACGDGIVDGDEDCDEGEETPTCDADCTLQQCGDGLLNARFGEACDDGNQDPGDACSTDCFAPTLIVGLEVGTNNACVVFADGESRCWGDGTKGKLGTGNENHLGKAPDELPVKNIDAGGKVVQITMGHFHACSRMDSGKLRCWGQNNFGQLGHGDLTDDWMLPSENLEIAEKVIDVSAGLDHTCAIVEGGAVRCWGAATDGQLGYLPTDPPQDPLKYNVPGVSDAVQIAATGWEDQYPEHHSRTCARTKVGEVYCWGYNGQGQLGVGNTDNSEKPGLVDTGGKVSVLAVGAMHACVLLDDDDGTVRCWGSGWNGALGYGNEANVGDMDNEMPPPDVMLGGKAIALAAGYRCSCALLDDDTVRCWGQAFRGCLGNGAGTVNNIGDGPNEMPPQPVDLGADTTVTGLAMRSESRSVCVTLQVNGSSDNRLRCWGFNAYGQLGLGHTMNIGDDELPAEVGFVPF